MIIVTGSGRSGSSMMMQTLRLWKYPLAGVPFHADFPVESLNPKGYWDLPFDTLLKGIDGRFSDMAVKVFGHWLCRVDSAYVNKMIVCKRRENKTQDESLMNAFNEEVKVRTNSEARAAALQTVPRMSDLRVIRNKNYREVRKFLKRNPHVESITMIYEDILENTEKELTKLAKFLGLEPTTMQEAIDNVDKK